MNEQVLNAPSLTRADAEEFLAYLEERLQINLELLEHKKAAESETLSIASTALTVALLEDHINLVRRHLDDDMSALLSIVRRALDLLTRYGEELGEALSCCEPLLDPDAGDLSRLARRYAAEHIARGLPFRFVMDYAPAAKARHARSDCKVLPEKFPVP